LEPPSDVPDSGTADSPAPDGVRSFDGRAFVLDGRAWCRALAGVVRDSPRGRVIEQAAVVDLAERPEGLRVTGDDGPGHDAAHVILAVGPWLPRWGPSTRAWAAGRGLRTKRVVGLDVAIDAQRRPRHAVGWPAQDLYLHPAFDESVFRVSLRHDVWDVEPDRPATLEGVDLDRVGRFLDRLLGAARWSLAGSRILADTYTDDLTPIVGPCPALGTNVTVATGTHGSGVRMAPGLADLVASRVLAAFDLPAHEPSCESDPQ